MTRPLTATPNPQWQAGVKERYDEFAQNLVFNGMNGALAVRETKGYNNKRARQTANRLNTIGYIKAKVKEIQADLAQKIEETAEKWLRRVQDTEKRARIANDYSAEARQQDIIAKHLGYFALDNAQKTPDARIFNLTQIQAILDADKAKVKEIDSIAGGIAGEELTGESGGL